MPSQQVLEEKIGEVEEIKDLLKGYKSIGIASLQKVRATQLQALKKNLADKVYMRVLKNTLTKLAIEGMQQENLKKLEEYLEGSTRSSWHFFWNAAKSKQKPNQATSPPWTLLSPLETLGNHLVR
jgi:hypothetical protein